MKYKITHPESDCEWIAENPKEEDLELWESQGCMIQEIKELKKGLLIGTSKLISSPNQDFLIWSCGACGGLFHTLPSMVNREVSCSCCKEKIKLDGVTK